MEYYDSHLQLRDPHFGDCNQDERHKCTETRLQLKLQERLAQPHVAPHSISTHRDLGSADICREIWNLNETLCGPLVLQRRHHSACKIPKEQLSTLQCLAEQTSADGPCAAVGSATAGTHLPSTAVLKIIVANSKCS